MKASSACERFGKNKYFLSAIGVKLAQTLRGSEFARTPIFKPLGRIGALRTAPSFVAAGSITAMNARGLG